MLSVAQAVHRSETPGSASKHSALGHPWPSERSSMLKRRKTEPECCIASKRETQNATEQVKKQYCFNDQEITLTLISKNNNQANLNELKEGKMTTFPVIEKEKLVNSDHVKEKESERIPTNIPPVVLSFLENSEEIQLTKLGSKENIKLVSQEQVNNNVTEESTTNIPDPIWKVTNSIEKNNFLNANSIDLTEVTIEPRPSFLNLIATKLNSASNTKTKNIIKSQERIDMARVLLRKIDEPVSIDIKSVIVEPVADQTFDEINYVRQNSPLFDEPTDPLVSVPSASTVSDYEPFNVGISCDHFYTNNKDKPHYATGFPNPPGENRCWTNATLQALFALPILNKLDSLNMPECSKLMTSLIKIQTAWRKGVTGDHSFNRCFNNFKKDLSALEELYISKAQQDVSEFIMNLLNFIRTEFENMLPKQSESNEIENIPNNEQDALHRSPTSTNDSNKRLPLADISASASQFNNNNLGSQNNSQSDILNVKTNSSQTNQTDPLNVKLNSSSLKSKNDSRIETNLNPIDEYFSLYMTENFICEGCSKERQQKVENLMLFIDLPSEDHGDTVKLVDIINTTYALEHRDMTCESCKHGVHSMSTKFKKIPKILTFQVKRYKMTNDGTIIKKCTLVEIPKLLTLDSLVINNTEDFSHSTEYEPMCIISHIGDNIDSGHYVSFVKHQEQWFYYDDMNVKVVSADEVFKCVQNNAYVIFFQDTELRQDIDIVINQKNKKESISS